MRRTQPSLFHTFHSVSPRALLAAGSLMTGLAAHAAGAHGAHAGVQEPALDNSGNYRQEVRACREGRTAEDLPTCLREARNAEADRKRGRLGNTGDLQANALARCNAFNEAPDKEACRARIVGHVEIQGSVAGGGILRQVAISVPAPQNPQQPASNAMGANPPPATAAPMDDIDDDEALPEEQDQTPGLAPGETLEEQPSAPEPRQ